MSWASHRGLTGALGNGLGNNSPGSLRERTSGGGGLPRASMPLPRCLRVDNRQRWQIGGLANRD